MIKKWHNYTKNKVMYLFKKITWIFRSLIAFHSHRWPMEFVVSELDHVACTSRLTDYLVPVLSYCQLTWYLWYTLYLGLVWESPPQVLLISHMSVQVTYLYPATPLVTSVTSRYDDVFLFNFTELETSPLPVKAANLDIIPGTHGYWEVNVL